MEEADARDASQECAAGVPRDEVAGVPRDAAAGAPFGPPPTAPFGPPPGAPHGAPFGPPPTAPFGPPPGEPHGAPFGTTPNNAISSQPAVGGLAPGIEPVSNALNMPAFAQAFVQLTFEPPLDNTALWYADIRGFRSINPKFGFEAGNMVLRTVVEGIRKFLSGDKPVTRLGGDRFVFVAVGKDLKESRKAFNQLVAFVNDAIASRGVQSHISFVAGMYYLREADYERHDYRRALDYASIAHRNAQGKSHSTLVDFTDEDLERDMRRVVIEQTIDRALADEQIEVWYQPQIDYVYGEVVGAEALARWNHPDLGWVSPAEFVPVLEACGRVHDLDLYVWERACRDAGRWRSASDGKPVPISVNVSRTEILKPGLLEYFKDLQKRHGLPDGSLHLEVTESAFVEEADRLHTVIKSMRDSSMVIEMDDFGSGLSSLNMLKDVPVDVVKLDMGFVRSGVNAERGGVVLSSVIRMLQGLDTPIIAEGVETLEQAEMLKNMGCHLMQGFHFSRPMPLDEFESYVATNTTLENTSRRERKHSHLEELMSFDGASSFLFNEVIGGTLFFFARDGSSESILVNDQFYRDCGLRRSDFGEAKIDPITEIDEASRETMWRAAAEARENGSAMCTAQVSKTRRWFEGVMRYIGVSARGDIFSLNICRAGDIVEEQGVAAQISQDLGWDFDMMNKIMPNGFLKCRPYGHLDIDYISPKLVAQSGLSADEFNRRFHNSFIEVVVVPDRTHMSRLVRDALETGDPFQSRVRLYGGTGGYVGAMLVGRVESDSSGEDWLYMSVIITGSVDEDEQLDLDDMQFAHVVPFDYYFADDLLVIHSSMPDGSVKDIEVSGWLSKLKDLPDNIDPASAAKVLATVKDLKHHPLAGFTDLKCNLRGGAELRWYHINYSCESDENGDAAVLHGFAHDANDEMGSAKWWRRQAETDQLTGLLNRSTAEQEINLKMRTHGVGIMFMIDLDEFKRINDDLGHMEGDNVLREVSSVLSEHFRDGDVLGRYGGDEFVAFMPLSAGLGGAYDLADRRSHDIIDAISRIEVSDGTHPGCSVGVAVSFNRDHSFYDMLEVADNALYASKLAGKMTTTITAM